MIIQSVVRPLRRTPRTTVSLPVIVAVDLQPLTATLVNYSSEGLCITGITGRLSDRYHCVEVMLGQQKAMLKPIWQKNGATGLEFADTRSTIDDFLAEVRRASAHAAPKLSRERDQPVLIGASQSMKQALQRATKAAGSIAPVFITGESGTGKDLLAAFLHSRSTRWSGAFVPLNCASLSDQMSESDLFGHKKGAFTGAVNDRLGAAARAEGGTLFLDEFAELDLRVQAKLLRFTQTGEYQRVGDDAIARSDARLICATNRSPAVEIKAGRLRSDLFFRLNVIPIHLPPLRERREDIPALTLHFLRTHAQPAAPPPTLGRDTLAWMQSYSWPGNIRQLSNAIQQCLTLSDSAVIDRSEIEAAAHSTADIDAAENGAETGMERAAEHVHPAPCTDIAPDPEAIRPLDEIVADYIGLAIRQFGGSIPKAAAALGVSPSTIYRRTDLGKITHGDGHIWPPQARSG
jgi:two-component system repressor protein LuxO